MKNILLLLVLLLSITSCSKIDDYELNKSTIYISHKDFTITYSDQLSVNSINISKDKIVIYWNKQTYIFIENISEKELIINYKGKEFKINKSDSISIPLSNY